MMNSKLVNVCAVCLITLALIFPSLTVFGVVWEKHLEFVKTQQDISTYSHIGNECSASLLQTDSLINNDYSKLHLNSNEKKLNLSNKSQTRNIGSMDFFICTILYWNSNLSLR